MDQTPKQPAGQPASDRPLMRRRRNAPIKVNWRLTGKLAKWTTVLLFLGLIFVAGVHMGYKWQWDEGKELTLSPNHWSGTRSGLRVVCEACDSCPTCPSGFEQMKPDESRDFDSLTVKVEACPEATPCPEPEPAPTPKASSGHHRNNKAVPAVAPPPSHTPR